MTTGVALSRSVACDGVASAEGAEAAQAQRKGLPDKRHGTAARQAVVVWRFPPCRTAACRAGISGKPLNAGIFHRAAASGHEVRP